MEIYLVGGAVRDKLLGLPVKERDWVIVGATAEELISKGYRPVGKDFPVFLHPTTHEEYALARTERKSAPGYKGFTVQAQPSVSLEEDLLRRDLTINALAEDNRGNIIDYHGGLYDLQNRILRHTSAAFVEDPVRILRVARFASRYKRLDFKVADETLSLMAQMVVNSEVDSLVPERVWQELVKALGEDSPGEFFEVLRLCGALATLFPELEALWGVPQPAEYHPEIDTWIHTLLVLSQATVLSDDCRVRFAALTHDLGKGTTPDEEWPRHHGHERRGAKLVVGLCARLKAPKSYRDLARLVARYHISCHKAMELRPSTLLKTLQTLDAFRRPERFEQFLIACESDFRGRLGQQQRPYPQAMLMRRARAVALDINLSAQISAGIKGKALSKILYTKRLKAIKVLRRQIETSKKNHQ
jgi:tRNA nucleotidyltransferase (CCA-adding enzyme)